MESYDEDLSSNTFLLQCQQKFAQLYDTVTSKGWIICVPRIGSLTGFELNESDFLTHVLIQGETEQNAYKTLSNKVVTIASGIISTGIGFSESRAVPILFEETFYNKRDEGFKVLCINQPLEGGHVAELVEEEQPTIMIQSLDDCTELLWGNRGNSKAARQLAHLIELFNKTCVRLGGESIRHQVDAANVLFTRAMQIVLKDHYLRKKSKNPAFMDNIKLAVETYLMHGVYRKLFKNVMTVLGSRDSKLNKITRNLTDLQLRDLGVRREFGENIPRARRELSNLNRFSTPLGKLTCIRRMIKMLMAQRSSVVTNGSTPTLTTDDLLPILVFLIVKSEINNWWANFTFMTSFRFSGANNYNEYGFFLASVEAALEHLSSGQVNRLDLGLEKVKIALSGSPAHVGGIWQRQDSELAKTERLFQYVLANNLEGVQEMLSEKPLQLSDIQSQLCHPLCSCPKCSVKVEKVDRDPSSVSTYSRDDRGCTVLHVAASQGYTEMTDLLVQNGAVVNATDYQGMSPLHIACQKGHQAVTLLLLHYKAQVNLQDNDKNTPMHLATSHGHEECVKALVYYDQGATQLHLNLGNDFGDTPLHIAARWGYDNLVEILLENGAQIDVFNRRKQTPLHVAHNLKIAQRLQQVLEELVAAQRRKSSSQRRTSDAHRRERKTPPRQEEATDSTSEAGDVEDPFVFQSELPSPDPKLQRYSAPPTPGSPSGRRASGSPNVIIVPANDISSASCPNLAWVAAAARTRRKSDVPLSTTEKKVEKMLKCVADGDIHMVKFHLGWADDDDVDEDDDDLDLSKTVLCHPLCQCDKCQPLQKFSQVSSEGVHINSLNSDGYSALHVASLHCHVTLVDLFLKRGARVNAKSFKHECTSLHLACQNNRLRVREVVQLLVDHEVKINQRDINGNTALHYCCLNGNHAAASVLLKAGCAVNIANQRGNTPLHEAVRWNFQPMVELLLENGANCNIGNRQYLLPSQLTQNEGILHVLHRAREKQLDSSFTQQLQEAASPEPPKVKGRPTIHELFSAFEERDLQALHNIAQSIQKFDRRQSLRHVKSFDRSAPILDHFLTLQLKIQNFDHSHLHPTQTRVRYQPVVLVDDELDMASCSTSDTDDAYSFLDVSDTTTESMDSRERSPLVIVNEEDCSSDESDIFEEARRLGTLIESREASVTPPVEVVMNPAYERGHSEEPVKVPYPDIKRTRTSTSSDLVASFNASADEENVKFIFGDEYESAGDPAS